MSSKPQSRLPHPSRRGLLAAGGAVGLGALLTACGGSSGGSGGTEKASAGGGAWSFTDGRKKTVKLEARPQRIVAFTGTAAALHDFGVRKEVVGVFGPTTLKNGKPDPQAGDLDVDRLTVIGNAYGEFNVEKYAGTRPELLVTNTYDGELWFVPEESQDKITALAPVVTLKTAHVTLQKAIEGYAELAESLGADLKASEVANAKTRFEKAASSLREAAKGNPVKVLACSGSPDLFYASSPELSADLAYFRELGVDFVVPDNLDAPGYFEPLSWENAGKYEADVLFLDNRTATLQPDALKSKPAWNEMPAVKAGQVVPWASEPRFSYAGSAPLLEDLAAAIRDAKKVI